MINRDYLKKLFAGVFFVVGLILITVVVLAIGIEKGLTKPKFDVVVLFRDVSGLMEGAPVRLAGVEVGTVGMIDFLDNQVKSRGLRVTLNIFTQYKKPLEKSSRVSIRTEGLLGEKYIEIRQDEKGPNLDLSKPIFGEEALDVQDTAEMFIRTAQSLKETSQAVKKSVESFDEISRKTTRLLDRVEQRAIEGSLFKLF